MGPSAVRSPATLATWTNDPPPLRAASGSACRQTSIAAVKLTSITRSHTPRSIVATGPSRSNQPTPAPLTT